MKLKILQYKYLFILVLFSCESNIKNQYNFGLESIKSRDYEGAIPLFTEIINKDSNKNEVYQSRGHCYFKTQKYALAISDYKKAFEIKENNQLNFNIGISYMKLRKFNLALNYLNKYERKDSNNKNLWLQKANCFNQLKNYSNALIYYQKAKIAYPDSIKIIKDLGLCNFQLSNYYVAIENLKFYLDSVENDKICHEAIAVSHFELKNFNTAKSYFDQMLEMGFQNSEKLQSIKIENLLMLGKRQYSKEKYLNAMQTFSEVITYDNLNNEAYFNRGLVQLYFERRIEACEDFNQAFLNGNKNAIAVMKKNCKAYFK